MNRVAASLAVCAALAAPTLEARQGPGAQSPTAAAADPVQARRAVAVLPFSNISGQPGDEWIGRGIADTVVTDLQRGGAVSVIGPEVMPQTARSLGADLSEGSERRVAELGQRIGAAWVVTGSYQRLGDRVRITARVVDVASGTVSRALKIDGTIDQLFALQDRVVAELGPDLRGLSASSALQPQSAVQGAAPQQNAAPASERPRGAGGGTGAGSPSASALPAPAGNLPLAIIGPPAPVPPAVINRAASGRATVRAVRLTSPLRIDGKLDESVYETVPSMSDFIQNEPVEGAPATEKTEVWIFFDEDNLYISARCWDSHPERMIANDMQRDSRNIPQQETFGIAIDTFYDHRNSVLFELSSIGGRLDAQVTNERNLNNSWNPVWQFTTGKFDRGWVAEERFPFKSLRYRPGTTQIWGINFRRRNQSKNETSYLVPVPASLGMAGHFRGISLAATLVGLEAPSGAKNIEIKPYGVSSLTTDNIVRPRVLNSLDGSWGADVKYGITQSMTADLTYNTDFAQVEADEQQINLTRFSLLFPEKRDFFLENQGTYEFAGAGRPAFASSAPGIGMPGVNNTADLPILFYSRRIGLDARGNAVPIVGGGRVTGRTGKFTLGLLNIESDKVPAAGIEATNFSVARVKRDILRKSSVGAIFTRRSVSEIASGSNAAYGVDGTFGFFDNLAVNAFWAKGESRERSGDDTSYRAQLDYGGDRYGLQLERLMVASRFNPETGYVRHPDMLRSFGQFRFSPRTAKSNKRVRKLYGIGSADYIENGAGRVDTRQYSGEFDVDFHNSDRYTLRYSRTYEYLPAPLRLAPGATVASGGYQYGSVATAYNFGPGRKLASGGVSVEHGTFYDGHKTTYSISQGRVAFPPHFSIEPNYSINQVELARSKFTTHLLGSRFNVNVTPLMFVGAFLQYNSTAHGVSTNVRFRWEYQPGSELFVVLNEQRDTQVGGFPSLDNRALIVKINRLFRF